MSVNSQGLSTERLLQLSNEVSRIAGTLARLSTEPTLANQGTQPGTTVPEVSADKVMTVIRARRLRTRYFPDELFADPAWDMMLELFRAELAQQRVAVSSLCLAAAVPATTALRWINTLVQKGMLNRRADPRDGRRVFVELAPETHDAMRRYFAEITHVPTV